MLDITRAPFTITVRELWLSRAINGNASLPSSRYNGHPLTLTGARKGTTADGVHFNGAATSNINCGAIHNNAATYWLKFRFKLDQPYAAGSGDQYLWGKLLDATHFLWLVFKTGDGKLYFEGQDGGANDFSIAAQDGAADITTWEAGRWYTVLASISAANNVRFMIDDGTVVTNASAIAFPNGGDFIIGDYDDPGAGTGFEGVISDFVGGIDNLSQAAPDEEYELYAGIPPADAVNFYPLDEGRGTTAYDRGSGGNNGTLDSSATWDYGECKHPVLSLDGINDRGQSSAGVDIAGDLTFVWVGKMKSTYTALPSYHRIAIFYVAAFNSFDFYYFHTPDLFRWRANGTDAAGEAIVEYSGKPSIDDYWIVIGTLKLTGQTALYINGSLVGTDTGLKPISGAAATGYLGRDTGAAGYDISKPLMVGLFDTAFTEAQARAFSRWLDNVLSLGIGI